MPAASVTLLCCSLVGSGTVKHLGALKSGQQQQTEGRGSRPAALALKCGAQLETLRSRAMGVVPMTTWLNALTPR